MDFQIHKNNGNWPSQFLVDSNLVGHSSWIPASIGRYVYKSGLKVCNCCGERIYLKQLGDLNQKRLEDLQRELKVIQTRLERTLTPIPTFNF